MDRGQGENLARMLGLHPYSFEGQKMGFFYDHRESGLGIMAHPKDGGL